MSPDPESNTLMIGKPLAVSNAWDGWAGMQYLE